MIMNLTEGFVLGPTRPFRCFPLGVANEMNKRKSLRRGNVGAVFKCLAIKL